MAEFKFPCPFCGQNIQCDTGYAGTQINCPACQQAIIVPQTPRSGTPVVQPPVPAKSRLLRNVLVIAAAMVLLAGLVVVIWFGYSKYKRGYLPSGVVALWSGEGNANDSVGGCNGKLLKSVKFAPGKVGRAFSFNGGNNVVISDQPSLNPTGAITIECWAYSRRNSPSYGQILVSKDGVCRVARQYLLLWGGGNGVPGGIRVHVGVPSGYQYFEGSTVLQTNTWYHVAMTYDGTTLKAYVNGKLDGQKAVTGPIITSSEPVRIGGGEESGCLPFYFDGLIDEPAIFNRALSAEEIEVIYTRQK